MSYTWGFIKKEKQPSFFGAVFMGVFITLFLGIPAALLFEHYNLEMPTIFFVFFALIIFSLITFISYHTKYSEK